MYTIPPEVSKGSWYTKSATAPDRCPFDPGRFQWKDKAFKACSTIHCEVNGNSGSSRVTENLGARARDRAD